jgi:hypothetical protein
MCQMGHAIRACGHISDEARGLFPEQKMDAESGVFEVLIVLGQRRRLLFFPAVIVSANRGFFCVWLDGRGVVGGGKRFKVIELI